MKFEKTPDSFKVQEILKPKIGEGKYFYYILKKSGIDTPNSAKLLEKENDTIIFFSGLKDSNAYTEQWICSEQELKEPVDKRLKLDFKGKSKTKIITGMHTQNKFTLKFTELPDEEKKSIKKIVSKVFPNYFDDQRFSKKSIELGLALLEKKYENAIKIALTKTEEFETEKSKQIKANILENFGNWKKLKNDEEIPQIKKKIFEYLEKEENYQNAIMLLEPKTVKLACRAAQAYLFNEKLKEKILLQKNKYQKYIKIIQKDHPIEFGFKGLKREIQIDPIYPKLSTLKRKTFFKTGNVKIKINKNDCIIEFELKKGSYGTILLKCILEESKT